MKRKVKWCASELAKKQSLTLRTYGDQIEECCLAQLLDKQPVTENDHLDADGNIVPRRFSSLKEPTGSLLKESINRAIINIKEHQIATEKRSTAYQVAETMARNLMLNGRAQTIDSLEKLRKVSLPGAR